MRTPEIVLALCSGAVAFFAFVGYHRRSIHEVRSRTPVCAAGSAFVLTAVVLAMCYFVDLLGVDLLGPQGQAQLPRPGLLNALGTRP